MKLFPNGDGTSAVAIAPTLLVPARKAFDLLVRKTHSNIQHLADRPQCGSRAVEGNYFAAREDFFSIDNWTSSFFTGMALLAWRGTEDEYFLQQTLRLEPQYRAKVFDSCHAMNTMHDLGFLYSLYSVALYKLTGESRHRETALRAAELLAGRFIARGAFIRAWGRMDDSNPHTADLAIIDCMMNLPLLYWSAIETGDSRHRDVARQHADTVLKHFVRSDGSVYHAYRFNLATGEPTRPDTYGGWAVESHWARGSAWAIYGFALSYGYTHDPKYLDAAVRIARKFIASLDEEVVPLWDFSLPPQGQSRLRDASAGSIAVCGLQEVLKYRPDVTLANAKQKLLSRLCTENYLDFNEACPGAQKNGQVGDGRGGVINAYTSWGDYYLMEA
ncbi:MAG: glycoside hydrolase family 88 protein, partial [Akkermansiaceae bacterium]|nr:glycoside hydrolase family 88 protein [Verrucomicrobiales bacterium]